MDNNIVFYEKSSGRIITITDYDYIDLYLETLTEEVKTVMTFTGSNGEELIEEVPLIIFNQGVLRKLSPLNANLDFIILTSGTKEEYSNIEYNDFIVESENLYIEGQVEPVKIFKGVVEKKHFIKQPDNTFAQVQVKRKNVTSEEVADKIVANYVKPEVEDFHLHLMQNFTVSNNALVENAPE